MKVAYMFSGHARTWNQTYENFFTNIFSVAPGDIFIHTWNITSPIAGSHWNGYSNLTNEQLEIATKPIDINGLYEAYKPKMLIVEHDPGPNLSLLHEGLRNQESAAHTGVQNFLNGTRKIFEHMVKYDNYDRVFHLRPDLNFTTKLDINELNSGKYYTPNFGAWDLWGFGTVDHFDIKTNFCHYTDKYWYSPGPSPNHNYETALLNYITDKGMVKHISKLKSETIRPF